MRQMMIIAALTALCSSAWSFNGDMGGTDPNGSPEKPYLIQNLGDFDEFASNPAYWPPGVHTQLETDLDLSGRPYGVAPIPLFGGNFDGQNHTISGLAVTGSRQCSLFGNVGGTNENTAVIKNLVLQHCDIRSDAAYNGCLCAWIQGFATIRNCHVKHSQISSPYDLIGGLIGLAESPNNNYIVNCSVVDSIVSGGGFVGGIVGASSLTTIQSCYTNCVVQGTRDAVGGIVGNNGSQNSIVDCYSQGDVSTVNGSAGGIVGATGGAGLISHCYASGTVTGTGNIGGIMGVEYNHANYEKCFWDITQNPSLQDSGNRGEVAEIFAESTANLKLQSTFTGWDFATPVWMMLRPGEDYPRLAWQPIYTGDIAGLYGIDMVDVAYLAHYWQLTGCNTGTDCGRADIDASGDVGLGDLTAVADDWLR